MNDKEFHQAMNDPNMPIMDKDAIPLDDQKPVDTINQDDWKTIAENIRTNLKRISAQQMELQQLAMFVNVATNARVYEVNANLHDAMVSYEKVRMLAESLRFNHEVDDLDHPSSFEDDDDV